MDISIRRFEKKDIPNKVKWINDPMNNTFLHYDLPLEIEKTEVWFEKNKEKTDRYDAIIEADGVPIGLIGLLSIDENHKKAEYYITIGERDYLRKGIASKASRLILHYAFTELKLNRVYLHTETANVAAIKTYERIGFKCEGRLKNDLFSRGKFVDRYVYGITKKDFYHHVDTPVQYIGNVNNNHLFIKREDFIPFSFGGNKARKAQLFFDDIDRGHFDCVVTYGSSSSNHCRIVSNMAAARNIPCCIISPENSKHRTYNSILMEQFGAKIVECPINEVAATIDRTISGLQEQGYKPYFIAGGGHGILGTQAYVDCYEEIRRFEEENGVCFDYIFHASGTGTTQAGLVCGQLIHRDALKIIGISIARKNPKGRDVILESIRDYANEQKIDISTDDIEKAVFFEDDYIVGGYGTHSDEITETVENIMVKYGVPLDATYTGKAFAGMLNYIDKESIAGKNILFIHTGGTPLYFDGLCENKH